MENLENSETRETLLKEGFTPLPYDFLEPLHLNVMYHNTYCDIGPLTFIVDGGETSYVKHQIYDQSPPAPGLKQSQDLKSMLFSLYTREMLVILASPLS